GPPLPGDGPRSSVVGGGGAGPPAHRAKPMKKLNTCSRSCGPLTIGKPKSRAIGTGPSIGTTTRMPKPAVTRYVCQSSIFGLIVPEPTNATAYSESLARIGTWYSADARTIQSPPRLKLPVGSNGPTPRNSKPRIERKPPPK